MASFLISYDLIKDKDYSKIINELERLKAHKALLSLWLVELNEDNITTVYNHFKEFIDDNDKLLVANITPKKVKASANRGTNDWLANHN